MVARSDLVHNEGVRQTATHRQHASGHTLAHDQNVWSHVLVLHGKHLASAAKTCLNLICDKKHIELSTKLSYSCEVTILRNDNSTFALNWLDTDGTNVWVLCELGTKGSHIVIGEKFKASSEGSKVVVASWVITGT